MKQSSRCGRATNSACGFRSLITCVGLILVVSCILVCVAGCRRPWPFLEDRYSKIPPDAMKGTPTTDPFPPILACDEWEPPAPMPGPVNSAGAEDSPFITPEGDEFYFFYTPDVRVPVEKQLLDSVTGIWACRREGGSWTEPERVALSNDAGNLYFVHHYYTGGDSSRMLEADIYLCRRK